MLFAMPWRRTWRRKEMNFWVFLYRMTWKFSFLALTFAPAWGSFCKFWSGRKGEWWSGFAALQYLLRLSQTVKHCDDWWDSLMFGYISLDLFSSKGKEYQFSTLKSSRVMWDNMWAVVVIGHTLKFQTISSSSSTSSSSHPKTPCIAGCVSLLIASWD